MAKQDAKTKTIFISVYDGDTEKSVLRSGTLDHLLRYGHRVVLLIRGTSRIPYYEREFQDPRITLELLPKAGNFSEYLWYFISWNSVPTRSVRLRRLMRYERTKSSSRYWAGTALWLLGHLRVWRGHLLPLPR